MCGPSLTKTSLCGARLYKQIYLAYSRHNNPHWIQQSVLGQTAPSSWKSYPFQGPVSSSSSGCCWWLGKTETDNYMSYCALCISLFSMVPGWNVTPPPPVSRRSQEVASKLNRDTQTTRQDTLLSVVFLPSHQQHREDEDGVSPWNITELSHLDAAVRPRTFYWFCRCKSFKTDSCPWT
jgi:hypothetical protein